MRDDPVGLVIWSGVHRSFSELPSGEEGFVHPRWVEKSVARLLSTQSAAGATPSAEYPILDAILAAWDGSDAVDVLDVGGNLGQLALDVRRRAPGIGIRWVVLEREDLLSAAREHVDLPHDIEFHSSGSSLAGRSFDVIHLGSVLQYFEDWRADLAALCDAYTEGPAWLVISDAMVGAEIESFVTRQTYYENELRMHFLNLGELLDHLAGLGFTLIVQEPYLTAHTVDYYPELALPTERRIAHPLNLILHRRS